MYHRVLDIGRTLKCVRIFALQYQHVPGHMTSLLRVAVEDSLDPAIRQVASITFKNLVKRDWSPAGGKYITIF